MLVMLAGVACSDGNFLGENENRTDRKSGMASEIKNKEYLYSGIRVKPCFGSHLMPEISFSLIQSKFVWSQNIMQTLQHCYKYKFNGFVK